jgi:hypothetical protein
LIYRFCEEEQPPFLNMMANSSANNKFQQLISTLVELTSGTILFIFQTPDRLDSRQLNARLRFLLALL